MLNISPFSVTVLLALVWSWFTVFLLNNRLLFITIFELFSNLSTFTTSLDITLCFRCFQGQSFTFFSRLSFINGCLDFNSLLVIAFSCPMGAIVQIRPVGHHNCTCKGNHNDGVVKDSQEDKENGQEKTEGNGGVNWPYSDFFTFICLWSSNQSQHLIMSTIPAILNSRFSLIGEPFHWFGRRGWGWRWFLLGLLGVFGLFRFGLLFSVLFLLFSSFFLFFVDFLQILLIFFVTTS